MKKVIATALFCLLIAGLSGCGNPEATPSEQAGGGGSSSEAAGPVSNYFDGEEFPYQLSATPASTLVVQATNESRRFKATVQVQVSFLKDSVVVASESGSFRQVPAAKKIAFSVPAPAPESYDDVTVTFTSSEEAVPGVLELSSSLMTSSSKESDGVHIAYQNTGDATINFVKYQVIYYQNNKVIGCETAVSTAALAANGQGALVAALPKDKAGTALRFDQYEVLPVEVLQTGGES